MNEKKIKKFSCIDFDLHDLSAVVADSHAGGNVYQKQ